MTRKKEIIQKIESHYVGDDCIQRMLPYNDALTVLSQDGILFHYKTGSNIYINKYLEDERRKQFPYYNIPTHYSRSGLRGKVAYTNQLFDFEKPYIRIGDNYVSESFAVKDNNQALLVSNVMQDIQHTRHMTYEELMEFVGKNNSDEQVFYINEDGSIPNSISGYFADEEIIYDFLKNKFNESVKYFRDYQEYFDSTKYLVSKADSDLVDYLKDNPWFLNYFERCVSNIDLSLIDFNLRLGSDGHSLMVIRINNGRITSIQGLDVTFVRHDDYKVVIRDIPICKYTLEQLKFGFEIMSTKEPKIPLSLNPGVTKQDIKEAKRMVKSLRGGRRL